ncbi:hypothetical protein MF672_045620 [Actinomadura sp. ATCC 31491]|uniref:Uncharacterized protein n=1 Tax=Actinomadura luzonensis TaxID=2805427 RepID=A0ABT0G8X4_9ACTN|nr:hypothetical protein [Actinomadura luzonensis]MCK2221036.1 hypothetical protein [Actinomadura luzonensis]
MSVILVWTDGRGRVWLDTGETDPARGEPVIELLNGGTRGPLRWVAEHFAPLRRLSP